MAEATLATADAVLKTKYVGPIIKQLNYKTYMLDRVQRESESVAYTGKSWTAPIHSARNRNRGSMSDGGGLVTPGRQGYDDATDSMKYHDWGLGLTDALIKTATGDNDGAFVNILKYETEALAMDAKKDMNRQIYGRAYGILSMITVNVGSSATQTVDSTQYLEVGDSVDVVTASTGAVVTSGASNVITAINRTTKVVTLTTAVDADVTDGFVLAGSYNKEIPGLRVIVGTGRTLHGINSATAGNEYWNSQVIDAGGDVASENLFEQLADRVGATGNAEIETFLTTRGIRRRLADQYQSQKRFTDAAATKINGGYSAIFVNEIPVIADDDAPHGYIWGINPKSFKWFEIGKPDWLKSEDGTVWHLRNGSTAGSKNAIWDAWFTWYATLGCLAPNQQGMIYGAADDTTP